MNRTITIDTHLTEADLEAALRADVAAGLSARPRSLPPKWFYDAVGSALFDQITRLPEYYPTEAERAVLAAHADEIVHASGCDTLAELGSGSSDKTRMLLDAFERADRLRHYLPLDVSASALREAADRLVTRYPGLQVVGVVGDFDHHLSQVPRIGTRLFAFLGGTIGNYAPGPRQVLLRAIVDQLAPGEGLLLGTDLVKSTDRLVAAYDDREGVTAAFNRNVLEVVNRHLDADFDPSAFDHVARWNEEQSWIEMRLRSTRAQTVTVAALGLTAHFEPDEELLTEISAKFTRERITAELGEVGLEVVGWWTDPAGDFAVSLSCRPA